MVSSLIQLVPGLPSTSEDFSITEDDQTNIGDGATKLFHKAIEEYLTMLTVQSGIRSPSMAKALIDRCWEELNTSHWAEVPDAWRILYSYAALFCAAFHLNLHLMSENLNVQAVKDALYHCDMGLIMGKPVFGGVLTRLATCCHQKLTACLEQDSCGPASKDMEPVTCEESISRVDLCQPISDPVPRLRCPSVERFVREVFGQRPAVLTDCVSHWPALQWTLASLERTAGHRTVPVELGGRYTDAGWSQRLMTLGEFIQQHVRHPAAGAPTGYLAQYELFQQIPELGADVPTPEYCYVGDSDSVHTNIWLGPAGTVSPLHHDPKHNCLVQVLGSKFVQVFSPEETPRLYPHEAEMLHNTSRVDAERPDLERFPDFAAARHQELVLGPGDLLYMPPRWWHYVRSLSVSCSVSFWFE